MKLFVDETFKKRMIVLLTFTIVLMPLFISNNIFANSTVVDNFVNLKSAIEDNNISEIIINGNINVESSIDITHDIIISSNNGGLRFSETNVDDPEKGSIFNVKNGKTLTLKNITLDGNNKGRIVYVNNATINLENAILKNGNTSNFKSLKKNNVETQVFSGGAIFADNNSIINIKGGEFIDNQVGGLYCEGGAIKLNASTLIINDETTTDKDTIFSGNHLDGVGNIGGRQGGAIEATDSTVKVYGASFNIPGPFNTGGAIKFEACNEAIVKNCDFKIAENKGANFGVAGGAITSENSNLTITDSTFATGKGTFVQESGGLIQVVGIGEFNLKNSTLTGNGVGWNQTAVNKTSKYGGAIVFYDGANVNANIENSTIQNFTAEISGGAIALNTQIGRNGATNLTIKNTNILNNVVYDWTNSPYGGGIFVGEGNTGQHQGILLYKYNIIFKEIIHKFEVIVEN